MAHQGVHPSTAGCGALQWKAPIFPAPQPLLYFYRAIQGFLALHKLTTEAAAHAPENIWSLEMSERDPGKTSLSRDPCKASWSSPTPD